MNKTITKNEAILIRNYFKNIFLIIQKKEERRRRRKEGKRGKVNSLKNIFKKLLIPYLMHVGNCQHSSHIS